MTPAGIEPGTAGLQSGTLSMHPLYCTGRFCVVIVMSASQQLLRHCVHVVSQSQQLYLLSPDSFLTSPDSFLTSPDSCLTSPVSHLMSHVSLAISAAYLIDNYLADLAVFRSELAGMGNLVKKKLLAD